MTNGKPAKKNYLTDYRIPIEITKHRELLHVFDDGKKIPKRTHTVGVSATYGERPRTRKWIAHKILKKNV